jgi:photosystem II stability/assembly factor-like uncharacterized protein
VIKTLLITCFSVGYLFAADPPNPPQFVDATPDFNSVVLSSDGKRAWVAAANGLIYKSADGGVSWNWTDIPGSRIGPLWGLYFNADRTRGWAVGEGRIAYSQDGGETWHGVRDVPNVTLKRVVFDGPGKRGLAVGDVVLQTEDGGLSWTESSDPVLKGAKDFSAVAFDSGWQHGLIGSPRGLIESRDGGRSWKRVPGKFHAITKVWVEDGAAAALSWPGGSDTDQTCWFWDNDNGRWEEAWDTKENHIRAQFTHDVVTIPGEHGIYHQVQRRHLQRVFEGAFQDVAFGFEYSDATHVAPTKIGMAVGQNGLVVRTEDAGATWRNIHEWPDLGVLLRIAIQSNPERIWVAGEKVFRTEAGSGSFQEVRLPKAPMNGGFATGVMDIRFSRDGRIGWMTTAGGAILRSSDGGENWSVTAITPPTEREIYRLSFAPDERNGVGVGFEGIFLTSDGGANWTRRDDAPSAFNDIWLANQGHTIWAVGPAGRIFRSDDWCKTWTQIRTGTEATMRGIKFRSDELGWAWGSATVKPAGPEPGSPLVNDFPSTILRTTDGGRQWTPAQITADGEVLSIRTLSFDSTGTYGFALADVDNERAVLRSIDGGATWNEEGQRLSGDKRTVTAKGGRVTQTIQRTGFTDLAMTDDGKHGWASGEHFLLTTAHSEAAPHITSFQVTSPDYRLDLAAYDPDTPSAAIQGTIELEGEGIAAPGKSMRRDFKLSEAQKVSWPPAKFHRGEKYRFHLRLSDGWNVVTRDYELVAGSPPGKAAPAGPAPLSFPELSGLDLASMALMIDGQRVPAQQIFARGSGGTPELAPSGSALQSLANGFHTLTVTRGTGDVLDRIGFYKEELTLKLFRPYAKSYVLLIAIADYPAQSGYRKLPNAVLQAKELEKTLRSQGFIVLPPLYDGDATRARIEEAIRNAPAGAEDRLLVYFGGHGDDEQGFQGKPVGYLMPYDGRKADLWGTAIPLEKFLGEYSARLRAKHVLFALDSCQSGLALERGDSVSVNPDELRRFKALADIEALSNEPGRTVLTAGSGGQDALDISGGIFTAALTDGIRGKADLDHNGVVDYFELFAYVWGRVNAEARQWTRKQQPSDYHLGNGRWVFVYQ